MLRRELLAAWKDAGGIHQRGWRPRCALEVRQGESERCSMLGRRQRGLDVCLAEKHPKIPSKGSFVSFGIEEKGSAGG